jgi:asparagine synthase (glutamine-hydrolysing)
MCGIYGVVDRVNGLEVRRLERQRDLLRHRGPDDAGVWLSEDRTIGLAHRRLAIVDLSTAGRQPMEDGDGGLVIVFNGEIYNFVALRAELKTAGFSFTTRTDTEVLLVAYRAWGEEMLKRLNGMFAFALLDRGHHGTPPSLFFARDRVGKKPFYYALSTEGMEFASELKALRARGELDVSALNHYLALGYIPHSSCIVHGVMKLPPAHAGRFDINTSRLKLWRYWRLPENRPDLSLDGEALATEAQRLLLDATRIRLQADVPVGVLLSGGLDSSLVTAAAAQSSANRIRTFSVGLPDSYLDESARARKIAEHFDTEHQELTLSGSGLAAMDELEPLLDEPLADSSIIPMFLISQLTRASVTVALGGDGGDELFGGYSNYSQSVNDYRRLHRIPAPLLAIASAGAARLPAGVRGRNRLASLRAGPLQQMIWGRPYFDVELRKRILRPEVLRALGNDLLAPERFLLGLFMSGSDPVDCMTRTDFGSILPDDFLVKVDRASMAVALEMRSPLMDYRLVDFAFGSIPSRWKVVRGESRLVQRIMARRWLPAGFDGVRKQGFSVPLDAWLRGVQAFWRDRCLSRLPEQIDKDEAAALFRGLNRGRANGARIFSLMMLGMCASNLARR